MFDTERNQPILVWASASPFSMLMFSTLEGHVDEAHPLLAVGTHAWDPA